MGLNSVALQYLSQVQNQKTSRSLHYVAMCFYKLGNKYHDLATDNLQSCRWPGRSQVDDETMLKLGLDPAIHRRSETIANPDQTGIERGIQNGPSD